MYQWHALVPCLRRPMGSAPPFVNPDSSAYASPPVSHQDPSHTRASNLASSSHRLRLQQPMTGNPQYPVNTHNAKPSEIPALTTPMLGAPTLGGADGPIKQYPAFSLPVDVCTVSSALHTPRAVAPVSVASSYYDNAALQRDTAASVSTKNHLTAPHRATSFTTLSHRQAKAESNQRQPMEQQASSSASTAMPGTFLST